MRTRAGNKAFREGRKKDPAFKGKDGDKRKGAFLGLSKNEKKLLKKMEAELATLLVGKDPKILKACNKLTDTLAPQSSAATQDSKANASATATTPEQAVKVSMVLNKLTKKEEKK